MRMQALCVDGVVYTDGKMPPPPPAICDSFTGMSTLCLFCDNNSGSKEHLWPKWIHERKDFGPLRIQRSSSEQKIIPNPEIMVKTVCGFCNNGWMSSLEAQNIPIVGSMMQDLAIPLDGAQQKLVGAWSVKTAMVGDSMKGRGAPNQFYNRDECASMRVSRGIPARTLIWIGRIQGMHLGNFGTDFEDRRLRVVPTPVPASSLQAAAQKGTRRISSSCAVSS